MVTVSVFANRKCYKNISCCAYQSDALTEIDTTKINGFFLRYPEFSEFKPDVRKLYYKDNNYIWYNKKGITEFAAILFNMANQLGEEGLRQHIPYKEELDRIFYETGENKASIDAELLISSLYFYYTKKVYSGISNEKSMSTGWFLPRDRLSYLSWLDTLTVQPNLLKKGPPELFRQYYNLRDGLKKYRAIANNGGWQSIAFTKGTSIKFGEDSPIVTLVRSRLITEGYLVDDSGKSEFDNELLYGISNYQIHHNREPDSLITASLINSLNVAVESRIKTISVNMERCRWIDTPTSNDYIAVNIPSFKLFYFKQGEPFLVSKVVVGKELNKTVVFSGEISQIVFSPYWNVPKSILKKEILPALRKNPDYLSRHRMEWHNGKVRQKPGSDNSLGLVKFIFPNANNIYLHDTPQKALFNKEDRAFSHGCIRVEKARDLAVAIMKNDYRWSEMQTDAAMNSGKENAYPLQNKIPVYIAYFTAWADAQGQVSFYPDIYDRDTALENMLFNEVK